MAMGSVYTSEKNIFNTNARGPRVNRVERGQLDHVRDLCQRYGLIWHHCADSRRCQGTPGLPDLIVVGPGGVLWREEKDGPMHTRPGQAQWKWSLKAAGQDWGLWLPGHHRDGTVEQELAALARA